MSKWKLVPVDPDDNMTQAGLSRFVDRLSGVADIYDAMLAAAPEPEPCVWTGKFGYYCDTKCRKYPGEKKVGRPYLNFNATTCCYCGHPLKVVAHE